MDQSFNLLDFEATYTPSQIPSVSAIHELSADRFIIAGAFDKINGQDRGGIAMIDSSGTLVDGVFDGLGSTTYKSLAGIVPSIDGGYFIYGAYHGYDDGTTNDTTQRMVSKLYGLSVGVQEEGLPVEQARVRAFPNPCTTHCTVQVEQGALKGTLSLLDLSGRVVRRWPMTNNITALGTTGIAAGNYRLQYRTEQTLESILLMISP